MRSGRVARSISPALARLFVHLGSLRDPREIAALAAASLPKVLPVEASQLVDLGRARPADRARVLALRRDAAVARSPAGELEAARTQTDPSVVCQVARLGTASGRRGAESVVWLPLRANAGEIGALVGDHAERGARGPDFLDTAAVLAAHVAASLDAAFALQRERLSAVTDPLTRILNRRGLEERLERELADAQEQRLPLSLLVIDCDDFKEINDRAGHEFGDALLREVADVLARSLPEGAEAARLGGDEFVVMLPGAGADAAEALGGQIRTLLADGLTDAGFPLRISAGISTYPFDGATPTTLLRAGDQALYAAKAAGKDRDRVVPRAQGDGSTLLAAASRTAPSTGRGGEAERRLGSRSLRRHGSGERDRGRGDGGRRLRPPLQGRSCSSSARLPARPRAWSATTSSTRRSTRSARSRSATRLHTGSRTFPLTAEVLRTGEPRTRLVRRTETSTRPRRSSSATSA